MMLFRGVATALIVLAMISGELMLSGAPWDQRWPRLLPFYGVVLPGTLLLLQERMRGVSRFAMFAAFLGIASVGSLWIAHQQVAKIEFQLSAYFPLLIFHAISCLLIAGVVRWLEKTVDWYRERNEN